MRLVCLVLVMSMGLLTPARALEGGNMMAAQASPYLRSHATDPVHWRPWGEAALAEAARLKRPIILSIGYLACHWCHVMQRESFSQAATAARINSLFVPILIDREERPDLDSLFQSAAALLGLPTGWPLTMFLTPDVHPFFGGTYFPNQARDGALAFTDVLGRVAEIYNSDPDGLSRDAKLVTKALTSVYEARPGEVTAKVRDGVATVFLAQIDDLGGGFGNAAKFPNWVALETLWRDHIRTGRGETGQAVIASLAAMADGGIYDHIGGGFFRYTTDPLWREPHFEKMLDVNAALLGLMTEVWRETKNPVLAERIHGTVKFLLTEMKLAPGAFAASLDADSKTPDGVEEEGAYYRWHDNDIRIVLGDTIDLFLKTYSVATMEGPAVEGDPENGTLFKSGNESEARRTAEMLTALMTFRNRRARPQKDDKLLADWNGMAIRALAEAGATFGETAWITAAEKAFNAADKALTGSDGRLHQSAVGERAGPRATLGGLAAMAHTALTLFETLGDVRYLDRARAWAEIIIAEHRDPDGGGFFATAADSHALPVRVRPMIDDPNPSGNARAVALFARLYFHTGQTPWRDLADKTLIALGAAAQSHQLGIAGLVNAADTLQEAVQVVIIGERREAGVRSLLKALHRRSVPGQILQVVAPGVELPDGHPARYKEQVDSLATVYVCRGSVCSLPATDARRFDETLVLMRRRP